MLPNSQETADLVTFTEEILNAELLFLCSVVCLSKPYHFKIFEGCLPQILLGPFLNTLCHLKFIVSITTAI